MDFVILNELYPISLLDCSLSLIKFNNPIRSTFNSLFKKSAFFMQKKQPFQ